MLRHVVLPACFVMLLLASCDRTEPGRIEALTALEEMANQQPGLSYGSTLQTIASDRRIRHGETFRPLSLAIFSMLDTEKAASVGMDAHSAEFAFTVFAIREPEWTKDAWGMSIGGRNHVATEIKKGRLDEQEEETIDGRFSQWHIRFSVPRDKTINALEAQPRVTLVCKEDTVRSWTFSNPRFALSLKELRDELIKQGEPALNYYLYDTDMDFYEPMSSGNIKTPNKTQQAKPR